MILRTLLLAKFLIIEGKLIPGYLEHFSRVILEHCSGFVRELLIKNINIKYDFFCKQKLIDKKINFT